MRCSCLGTTVPETILRRHAVTERAVLLTGIGGQGVQLAAKTLAVAAIADGREAMMFGEYSGMMRGGNTDATVVIGTSRLLTPPTVSRAWGAVAMHREFWADIERRLLPGGVVIVDSSIFLGDIERTDLTVFSVPATETASAMKNGRGASMVALGALAAATGLVRVESLVTAIAEVLPSYRARHAGANGEAIRAGYGLVEDRSRDAWAVTADGGIR
jgi:2-oxoglutarate ferredoxin oxidoreductase subunit gamma